jgi:polyisoprenoid-binding protein YceI
LPSADFYDPRPWRELASGESKVAIGNPQSAMTKGVWRFDPAYTTVEFVVRNLWYDVKVCFKVIEGAIELDESDVSRSSVTATIKANSINTGNNKRDAHLLLRDFFDVENFPDIQFQSTTVRRGKDRDSLEVDGKLTIKNKTIPVALAVNEMDRSRSPKGEDFIYYSATTELDRFDLGINYGRVLIGRRLKVTINVQASNTPR